MIAAPFPPKAPDDRLDYAFDHSAALLAGETLAGATVAATPAGLVVDAITLSGGLALAWIAGGAADTGYVLASTAVTSQGRTIVASETLYVGPIGLDYGF